jgi:hypothetical protein
MALSEPCGVLKGLQNILSLKVGIINQQFFNRFSRAYLREYPADGQAYTPDTGLTAHYTGILGNTIKMFKDHFCSLINLSLAPCASIVEAA